MVAIDSSLTGRNTTLVEDPWRRRIPIVGIGGLLFLGAAQPAGAQELEPLTFWDRIKEKGVYERIWEKLSLYENEENDVLQALSAVGRYQGQYWSVSAHQGHADGWENRRVFLGAKALMFRQVTMQVQTRVSEDFDPFYDGLFQAFVKWSPADEFSFTAGRVDFLLNSLERSTSSVQMATFERGQLVNQVMPGQVIGAIADGSAGKFNFRAGVFSGSINKEFTDFQGGVGAIVDVGYPVPLFFEDGSLHLDYLCHDGDPANNAFRPYDGVVSLWHQGHSGPFSLGLNLTWAHGLDPRPAVLGLTVLPSWVFAKNVIRKGDALQAVLRYQFGWSDGNNGLELQPRYEQELSRGRYGDRYQAIYAGVNYLLYGDRLKLMTGAEYSVMTDSAYTSGQFEGWTYFAGVRVYF